MKFIAVVLALAAVANAATEQLTLKDKIALTLEAHLTQQVEQEVEGIENCENKCEKVFNRFAYLVATEGNTETYEYRACMEGCNKCSVDLAQKNDKAECFTMCKNYDWKGNGILKGVVEPDKACIAGCIIQTCQVVCAGGTTDNKQTKANKKFWYPNGGCSIKTQPYSQNLDYVPWDSPNSGGQGAATVAQCCANALSLCDYVGNKDSTNYKDLLAKTASFCKTYVADTSEATMCAFFNNPANCGQL